MGVKLFNRDNSCRIFPNETGLNFYEKVSNIVNQLENVILDFSKQENDKESKILRIGVSSFTLTKLIPLLPAFEDANKNITLNINVYEHNNALDLLEENKLDIFISSKENYEEIDPKIEFIKIMNYIPYWVLWKGHPLENKKELTKDDLINSKIVFDEHNSTSKSFKDFCEDCKIKSTLDIKNFSLEAQKLLIKNEIGIGPIFDVFLNKDDCVDFVFKNATNLFPAGEYGFYTKKIRKVIANKFIEYFSKCIKDNFSFEYKE